MRLAGPAGANHASHRRSGVRGVVPPVVPRGDVLRSKPVISGDGDRVRRQPDAAPVPRAIYISGMERPVRFEHHRWLGDKRTQVVHDVDACDDPSIIEDIMTAESFLCFGPDELAEARNRGSRRCRCCGADADSDAG